MASNQALVSITHWETDVAEIRRMMCNCSGSTKKSRSCNLLFNRPDEPNIKHEMGTASVELSSDEANKVVYFDAPEGLITCFPSHRVARAPLYVSPLPSSTKVTDGAFTLWVSVKGVRIAWIVIFGFFRRLHWRTYTLSRLVVESSDSCIMRFCLLFESSNAERVNMQVGEFRIGLLNDHSWVPLIRGYGGNHRVGSPIPNVRARKNAVRPLCYLYILVRCSARRRTGFGERA